MLSVKAVLFVTLGLFAAVFIAVWAASVRRVRRFAGQPGPQAEGEEGERHDPAPALGLIGFVVNFFDTLGIGSFATTTSIFKLRRLVPDRLIPGTLNVGLALPTFAQALIYISIVQVDMRTLVLMIAAAVAGAWLGAGVVAGWSRRNVQIGMGIALLFAAALMLGTQLQLFPLGGDALGVLGVRMAIALVGNFALGALMTLGIGLYAPCMILVSLLGMNPKVAFPIMMGSCAFLMPVGGIRFIRKQSFAPRASLWLTLTGVPAVLVAAYLVRSLPLGAVRWLVVVVVIYTAGAMLWSAWSERAGSVSPPAPALDPTALP
ncbi:MAG TPA: sulfite exporter TauE/SafE family protein [Thermoanaerobaculia bacterium]|nr:sulfite exporter TauE/SafE family protein [Thermoanaerobaculia bacterium]